MHHKLRSPVLLAYGMLSLVLMLLYFVCIHWWFTQPMLDMATQRSALIQEYAQMNNELLQRDVIQQQFFSAQQQTQKLLMQIHRANPKRLAILDELTRCLPVDAVLDRFSISGKQVLIDGEARSPEALISDLQCSKLLVSPSLVGTLQANAQTGKQRFSLRAELAQDNPHAP